MVTAFDMLLIATAMLIMLTGFSRRWSLWRKGRSEQLSGSLSDLLGYLLLHRKIIKRRYAGIAHLFLFLGTACILLVVILGQFSFSIPLVAAEILSLLLDILGLAMLVGTFFFIFRQIGQHSLPDDGAAPKRVLLPSIILLVILTTGFLAEGSRISIVSLEGAWISPVGWVLAKILPDSPLLMQIMIRCHFLAVLLFMAILPFTFMRHLAAAPLNVYFHQKENQGRVRQIALEEGRVGAGTAEDFTWKQLLEAEACVACGRCVESCPAAISGKPLSPRKIMQDILQQMQISDRNGSCLSDTISNDEIWCCTTCLACVTQCPVFVEPVDKIIDMRRYQVMGCGQLPAEARPLIRDLKLFGDTQGKGRAHRTDWALDQEVPVLHSGQTRAEILLWVGCAGAFHPQYQQASKAMVKVLKSAGVNFAILGKNELCCGDPARRLGDEALFLSTAQKNIKTLQQYQVHKIVTLCPHCFNTLKNEYAVLGGEFKVLHASQFVMSLIEENRIVPRYPVVQQVSIQDPCYLGRANNIYDPLRDMCRAVPGTILTELPRNREQGFCCGGGGGSMWLHESSGRHINQLRAEEIARTDIGLVATACPYCLTMLKDGISSLEMEKPPQVMDLIEIIASSIG